MILMVRFDHFPTISKFRTHPSTRRLLDWCQQSAVSASRMRISFSLHLVSILGMWQWVKYLWSDLESVSDGPCSIVQCAIRLSFESPLKSWNFPPKFAGGLRSSGPSAEFTRFPNWRWKLLFETQIRTLEQPNRSCVCKNVFALSWSLIKSDSRRVACFSFVIRRRRLAGFAYFS